MNFILHYILHLYVQQDCTPCEGSISWPTVNKISFTNPTSLENWHDKMGKLSWLLNYEDLLKKTLLESNSFFRSSSLFNTGFLKRMLSESFHHGLDDIQTLIKTLIFESECTPQSQFSVHAPSNLNKQGDLTEH